MNYITKALICAILTITTASKLKARSYTSAQKCTQACQTLQSITKQYDCKKACETCRQRPGNTKSCHRGVIACLASCKYKAKNRYVDCYANCWKCTQQKETTPAGCFCKLLIHGKTPS
ncbi:hypothetical protein HOL34_02775 [bacterium]|nr:hypothetical protein [bacterium]MBT3903798.1 hypothetical protein [bacterium]MBT4577839.1 hypothetical protein [bacterium]MBT5346235.1 hypothetical protein [bacterium]MBT6131031.1 hypothetical protein [bacterium]